MRVLTRDPSLESSLATAICKTLIHHSGSRDSESGESPSPDFLILS
jgi:hypothetical protein